MYLKSLDLVGFKSFAERTKLEFEPGLTAIVGPNGCGKSNIADAVRWVLGEQSAKSLRGSKMEDCIFNGTDTLKPLGMAEVSMTFADCESVLGTEFNEITVTRRVFRSGEGQYFINKTPCRLKDIQRLFMDTGMGTDSYSLMEQGRIDQILSSHPEDRREVFEEASGITKFKADKKEAIRKLEQTEANLLRLADIIREVRRQIISLQRQAGKARRYKTLQQQLRAADLYATRDRLNLLDRDIEQRAARLASLTEQEEAFRADVEQTEQEAARNRAELAATERAIADAMEASVRAQTDLERARELIRVNEDRIRELEALSARDTRDVQEARERWAQHQANLGNLAAQRAEALAAKDAAEQDLQARMRALSAHDENIEGTRRRVHDLGGEAIDVESRVSRLQNELHDLEAGERNATLRRERLAAEQAELQHAVEVYESRQAEMARLLAGLQEDVRQISARYGEQATAQAAREEALTEMRLTLAELKSRLAAREAQVEMLGRQEAEAAGWSRGARCLLHPPADWKVRADLVLGVLAEHVTPEPHCRIALEAALRAWLDAVVVSDQAGALDLLRQLEQRAAGAARLFCLRGEAPPGSDPWPDGPGTPLANHVQCAAAWRPAIERLLRGVRLVEDLGSIPVSEIPFDAVLVTPSGAVCRGNGMLEFWMTETPEASSLTRHHLLHQWAREAKELLRQRDEQEQRVRQKQEEILAGEASLATLRGTLEEARHQLSQREGENHFLSEEADQARQRRETVSWESQAIQQQQAAGSDRRTAIHDELEHLRRRQTEIRSAIAQNNDALRSLECERTERANAVTEFRVSCAEKRKAVEHLTEQQQSLEARLLEIEALIRTRSEGLDDYQVRLEDLRQQVQDARARIEPLEQEGARQGEQLQAARLQRNEKMAALTDWDGRLRSQRAALDEVRALKSQLDVEVAEQRVRRLNILERVAAEYHVTPEQLAAEPEPAWENGLRPDRDTLETMIAELRAKLESMGPVNLVAIEEHQALEERFAFLTRQQEDLIKAKQQLMDLIRRINKTTTEMFSQTFNQVNANFQDMFQKIFGGGSAKLILVDEDDVLESGIEIIARPPGKKLQTASLLSGGERTMTAVALLFALYMVKPSPFCLLDELDAALDEANIVRFIKVVQGFLEKSQFIVITHNRQTIGAADILYGVTMEQEGISKIVSVKFSHHTQPVLAGSD